ncbi:MAG TPA: DNA ligase D [Nevskiaceae bacterium]|nr:DNA ligase D [Nevskiaceae bacterium]
MGLGKYFKKRNFKGTPEPKGTVKRGTSKKLAFVVQEHHASRLHYDFRLEIDGVLKSWAVPKGPSMDPHEHHLAIQTEDHPFEYRTFEGVIPEGNYGAGNVIIWDEGWYEARKGGPEDSEATMRKELKKGHLTFIVHGKKLKGEFALIKMHNNPDENAWLLVKKGDAYATGTDVTTQDESVKSHKKVDDMGAKNKLPSLADYPKKTTPWQVKPMLCTLVDQPFNRDGWLFEIKWDGYRAIGTKKGSKVELYSRNDTDFTTNYPPVVEALRTLKHDVILDGEIVVTDEQGKPHFEWLQSWRHEPQGTLNFYVFDILWCDGYDVRTMPLIERKKLLQSIVPKHSLIRYSDHVETNGLGLFKQMQKQGLEGIVAKQADSPYRENDRGAAWLKTKTHQRQEVVIGGYTEPRGGRKYLGALLVGVYDRGEFVYVGHSGGGIPDDQRKTLQQKLAKLERQSSPFSTTPKPNAPIHWVRPELVCEMSFSEWTSEGSMRHPQFEGMRADKKPTSVHREKPKPARPQAAEPAAKNSKTLPFALTHLDKVFFPKHKYTKGDLIKYYESVAEYMLPYLQDRPCSLNRMPNGITGESFYQKNNEHLPPWVPHANIFSDSNNANLRWIVGGDLPTLLYMVQLGCVEINPWNSRVKQLNKPDWIVIDLDPEGVGFKGVVEVARTVRDVCKDWHISNVPKTSGKTGIHIYIPLAAKYTYEQGKNLAHLIALEVNKRQPKLTSVERNPAKRKHKIYVDFLQNREGQTLAAPYSVRPTPEATVSMPLHWDEVTPALKPTDFTIQNAAKRLKHTGDIWKPIVGQGIDLANILKKIEAENT